MLNFIATNDKLITMAIHEADVIREDEGGNLHMLARIGPGHFFGEEGLAYRRPRNAHVVAVENVTCLVFSPSAPSNFAGRGDGANLTDGPVDFSGETSIFPDETINLDVTDYVPQKVAAMAAHRTQFPIEPDTLPLLVLRELFGQEYFVRFNPPAHPMTDEKGTLPILEPLYEGLPQEAAVLKSYQV
jgi:hypothetical protein